MAKDRLDPAALDRLGQLREQLATVESRLLKLETEKERIHLVVYERVHTDYNQRRTTLATELEPLAEAARRDGVALAAEIAEHEATLAAGRFDKEELELRHRLGEISDADLLGPLADVDGRLAEAGRRHEEAVAALARVRQVMPDLDEAVAASEPAEEAPAPPSPAPATAEESASALEAIDAAAAEPAAEGASDEPSLGSEPAESPAPPVSSEDGTALLPLDEVEPPPPPPPIVPAGEALPPPPPPPPVPSGADGATVVLATRPLADAAELAAAATLLLDPPVRGLQELRLGVLTTVGRIGSNSLQLEHPSVSRRHAEIGQTSEGYVLRDLGSENGTLVNGDRVSGHCRLSDGDRIEIGGVVMLFRAGR